MCTWLDAYVQRILGQNSFEGGENVRPEKILIFGKRAKS